MILVVFESAIGCNIRLFICIILKIEVNFSRKYKNFLEIKRKLYVLYYFIYRPWNPGDILKLLKNIALFGKINL